MSVSILSGLPIRETIQDCQAVAEELFREDRVNEIHRNLRKRMGLVGSKLARFLQLFFNVHLQFPKPTT